MREPITLTQKEVQEIVYDLQFYPEEKRFSRCLDILVDRKGEYNHKVAHDLTEMANRPTRGAVAKIISKAEAIKKLNTVVFSY